MYHCSLSTVKLGDWLLQVSLSDDVYLLFGYNRPGIKSFFKAFQTEDALVNFMENLNDQVI